MRHVPLLIVFAVAVAVAGFLVPTGSVAPTDRRYDASRGARESLSREPGDLEEGSVLPVAQREGVQLVGQAAEASRDRLGATVLSDGVARRVFAGHVVSASGSPVVNARVFVFDRAPLPGEDVPEQGRVVTATGQDGSFRVAVPEACRGETVFVTVWLREDMVGSGVYVASPGQTILVEDPAAPLGFPLVVEWPHDRPEHAAVMLQDGPRRNHFGEAIWATDRASTFVELGSDISDMPGELQLLVGALPDPDRPSLSMLGVYRFQSYEELRSAAARGIAVECQWVGVRVGAYGGSVPDRVGVYSHFDPRPAAMVPVKDGVATCLLSDSLAYRACSDADESGQLLGVVRRDRGRAEILWLHRVERDVGQEVHVVDIRGEPVADAVVRFSLLSEEPIYDRLHECAAKSDSEGIAYAQGFCRGDYRVRIEASLLGSWRRFDGRVSIPCNSLRVELPDAYVCRLEPSGLPDGMDATEMRGWQRSPGGGWRECTDREWRLLSHGVVGVEDSGPREFLLRIPPFVGSATIREVPANDLHRVAVRMQPETAVRGVLRSEDGKALAGCVLTCFDSGSTWEERGPDWSRAKTDEHGAYELVLPPGHGGMLFVWSRGQARPVAQIPAADGEFVIEAGR